MTWELLDAVGDLWAMIGILLLRGIAFGIGVGVGIYGTERVMRR